MLWWLYLPARPAIPTTPQVCLDRTIRPLFTSCLSQPLCSIHLSHMREPCLAGPAVPYPGLDFMNAPEQPAAYDNVLGEQTGDEDDGLDPWGEPMPDDAAPNNDTGAPSHAAAANTAAAAASNIADSNANPAASRNNAKPPESVDLLAEPPVDPTSDPPEHLPAAVPGNVAAAEAEDTADARALLATLRAI